MNFGEEIAARVILFFAKLMAAPIGLLLLPFVTWARNERQKKRRAVMANTANELHLAFDPEERSYIANSHRFLRSLVKGFDHKALNIMNGTVQGRSVTVFDYSYKLSEGEWWWAPSWKRRFYASFVLLTLERGFPSMTICAESRGLFSKIAEAFGGGDIDFESHEFSKRYDVRCTNKKFAYDFCNARMIEYLLEQPVIPIAIEQNSIHVAFETPPNTKHIGPHLEHLVKVRALMPGYLFA